MNEPTTIETFMSRPIHTIGTDSSVAEARRRMTEHGCRHLLVLRGGHLEGVVSERDLVLVEGVLAESSASTAVDEVMSGEVYTVAPDASASEVFATMAARRLGAAVVSKAGTPIGIVTTTDGLAAAAKLLGAARVAP